MAKTLYKDPATDAFAIENGLVTGCRVDIEPAKATKGQVVYRAVSVRFLNEEQARGDTRILVSVIDRNGQPTMAKVINAWPQQRRPNWDDTAYDWASPGHMAEFAMGGGNYDPSKNGPLGPYVIYVEQGPDKKPVVSDVLIGFGLPGNRHVDYQVVMQECLAYVDDVYQDPGGGTPAEEPTGCAAVIVRLVEAIAVRRSPGRKA